jgi:hypothetical protein
VGVAVILLGLLFPRAWYDALPTDPRLVLPPIKGVTLFQLALVLEGLALAVVGWLGLRVVWGSAAVGGQTDPDRTAGDLSPRAATIALVGVTLLGLGLRLIRLEADLWLDEITPIARYRGFSALEVVATYLSSNNHLLNTLLVKLTTALFGEREWAVRLPALLFGVAAIPVFYWVARLAMSRLAALGAALLLATSYHHVFFSQNARGYSAYLCLSLVATGCFVRGLLQDRPRSWAGYIAATVANFASLLHSAFVFGGQALVGALLAWTERRRGRPVGPLLRRGALVFGVTGVLGFQLYATMLPQAYVVINTVYRREASGFSATSGAFLSDLLTGLVEGFGAGWWLLLPFGALGAYGFFLLLRRQWLLGAGLALPPALTLAVLAARGLSASPRFFLLGLPLADLAVVLGIIGLVGAVARRRWTAVARDRLAVGIVAVLALASLAALPRYYRTPKQAYRATLAYLAERRAPGDVIVLVHTAEQGFRFYASRAGLTEGEDFVVVRSVDALDEVVRAHGAGHALLVTTFRRALQTGEPALYARIEAGWSPGRRFPGTVHDGTIAVWEPRGT